MLTPEPSACAAELRMYTNCGVFLRAAHTAAPALSRSALRTRHPLCEAAHGLQHVVGAALPGEPVSVPGERQRVQLAAVQPLRRRRQQHALLQQDQVRWAPPSNQGSWNFRKTLLTVST